MKTLLISIMALGMIAATTASANEPHNHTQSKTHSKSRELAARQAYEKFDMIFEFSDGLAVVKLDGWLLSKYGYINENYKVVIEPQYYAARSFVNGRAKVYSFKDDGWFYIDRQGTRNNRQGTKFGDRPGSGSLILDSGVPILTADAQESHNHTQSKTHSINRELAEKQAYEKFDMIFEFSEGLAVVMIDTWNKKPRYGYINENYEVVLEPRFTEAKAFSDGLAEVQIRNKWGSRIWITINTKGEMVRKL